MSAELHRWHITLAEAVGVEADVPSLLLAQDRTIRAIGDQILSANWFTQLALSDYLTRKNEDGVGVWFQVILGSTQAERAREEIGDLLRGICTFRLDVERQRVLPSTVNEHAPYRSLEEEQLFLDFLKLTTRTAIELVSYDAREARSAIIAARCKTRGDPAALTPQDVRLNFEPIVSSTHCYRQLGPEERDLYWTNFSRIVNGQHWAHFLCNMTCLVDPHPAYTGKPIPEVQFRWLLGLN